MTIFTDPAILKNEISTKLVNEDFLTEVDFLLQALNIVESVLPIVSNSSINFKQNVAIAEEKKVRVDAGIKFSNSSTPELIQEEPYLGIETIRHNFLTNLDDPDAHPQLLKASGDLITGNLGIGNNWINSNGVNNYGISFKRYADDKENILFAENTSFVFDSDNSELNSVAGAANAWISFDATVDPLEVRTSFNVSSIEKTGDGKFKITFNNPLQANYLAIASSNGDETDIDVKMINAACTVRHPEYCTLVIQDTKNRYINTKHNDLVLLSIR
jgi:hypothetical protein